MTEPETPMEFPPDLNEEDLRLFVLMLNRVEQYRKIHGEALRDYKLVKMRLSELLLTSFERMAREKPERLAKMLPSEQLVKELTPEQLAKALTPEQLTEMFEALPLEIGEQIKQRLTALRVEGASPRR
jgi:hypothetical protein